MVSKLIRPLPYTLLSLDQYARIMGISPAHFWGTLAINVAPSPVFPVGTCHSIWHQYSWQDTDQVSRYDVAVAIARAESDLANALGYWPAPVWLTEEKVQYTRTIYRELYALGVDIRGMAKEVNSRWKKIISPGKRAVTFVGTATTAGALIVYSDDDSDGLYETATVHFATTLTDVKELKLYYPGYGGRLEYEIREVRDKYLSGGFVYFVLDSWLMVNRLNYEKFPTDAGVPAVDISTTANFITSVDIYREYIDSTDESVVFYWENANVGCAVCGGAGCAACGAITQDGCLRIRDADNGILVPVPASYDTTAGSWTAQAWSGDREPDYVSMYYLAGLQSEQYRNGREFMPMPYDLQMVIAHLATARLERGFCGCNNLENLAEYLREDMTRAEKGAFFTSPAIVNNPFGHRRGEIEAWNYTNGLVRDRKFAVAVI